METSNEQEMLLKFEGIVRVQLIFTKITQPLNARFASMQIDLSILQIRPNNDYLIRCVYLRITNTT